MIVSILVAYLFKTGRRDRLRFIWIDVAIAVATSIALAVGREGLERAGDGAVRPQAPAPKPEPASV